MSRMRVGSLQSADVDLNIRLLHLICCLSSMEISLRQSMGVMEVNCV
jgi:hypothetical protein